MKALHPEAKELLLCIEDAHNPPLMFTLFLVLMLPASASSLDLVYAEAPMTRFETYDECAAWRDVLELEANAYGWEVSVAVCEPDVTT